jgi:hypothetical protein
MHNLRLSRLRPPLPYRGSIFFFTSGNRRTIIGRTAIHPASYRAPALPQALPPSVRHRSRDPSNSGMWLHLLSHRHALTPKDSLLPPHLLWPAATSAAPGRTLAGTKEKKRYACLFLYGDYNILAFSHIVISCCGLVYMVVSFE